MLKALSRLCFGVMVIGLAALATTGSLFSSAPLVVVFQAGAVALMVWARTTFGRRSFHAAADPTAGGIVRSGPYRFIRHPIYTAACLFTLAGVSTHRTVFALSMAMLVLAGAIGRMLAEEALLMERYPEYIAYAAKTSRMLPFLKGF